MHKLLMITALVFLAACGGLVPKKYPKRSPEDTFYDFNKTKKFIVFDVYCEDNDCKKKKAVTEKDLSQDEEWSFFSQGKFIIINENQCFK